MFEILSSHFSWYHLCSSGSVLDAIDTYIARTDPTFVKKVIAGYLQTKIDKGKTTEEVDCKMDSLEQAMIRRRLPDFTSQIVQIRKELSLPPSKHFPRRSRRARTNGNQLPSYSAPNPNPREARQVYLYLPQVVFKPEDGPPTYSRYDPDPQASRSGGDEVLA